MTKKDYTMIAETIAAQKQVAIDRHLSAEAAMRYLVIALCEVFGEDNPRFDCAKFVAAARMPDGENYGPNADYRVPDEDYSF